MSKSFHQPPRWADRFLQWFCDEELLEDLQGDLHERFAARLKTMRPFFAKALFVWDVLLFLRPYTWKREGRASSFLFMSRFYVTSSIRNLRRHPLHTGLNISGLVISLSAFALVFLYVSDELKYDRHYDKADRIWRITTEIMSPTANNHAAGANGALGRRLQEQYPEIESFVSMYRLPGKVVIHIDDKSFQEDQLYRADRTYFEIFSHDWIAGNPAMALDEPNKIVLTATLAETLFGTSPAIGQTLYMGEEPYKVSGVIADLPAQTDLRFAGLLSPKFDFLTDDHDWTITYLLFRSVIDVKDFQAKLDMASRQYLQGEIGAADAQMQYHMEKLPDVHFGSKKLFDTPKSSRVNVIIFSVVGILILIMGCINYTNLAMMRVIKMRSQAGIRKVMGAMPRQLFRQSVSDSMITCSVSVVLAWLIAAVSTGMMSNLTGREFSAMQLLTPQVVVGTLVGTIVLAILAGVYPAMVLSSAHPATALNGQQKVNAKNRVRKTLVVVQFAVSIALLTCGKVVYDQWQLLTTTDPGFNTGQVLVIDVPAETGTVEQLPVVRNELSELTFVTHLSTVGYNSLPTSSMDIDAYDVMNKGENATMILNNITVDSGYLACLNIPIVAGRNFNSSDAQFGFTSVLVNESLVKTMAWQDPLGQLIYQGSFEYEVVGVVADFHFNSLHRNIEPIILHGTLNGAEKLLVKVSESNFDHINAIDKIWKKNTGRAMESQFLDTYYDQQYNNERKTQTVLEYFSAFTLIVACIGLFGLVAASTTARVKEFAIRKTLGAQAQQITTLVLSEYVWLFLAGTLLAVPMAWWAMQEWLSTFTYKTSVNLADFILPVLLTLGSIVVAIAYHVFRASRVEPATNIRHN